MIEKALKLVGSAFMAVLMVAWLAGCSGGSELAHDHDDASHSHDGDEDGEGHHGAEDADAVGMLDGVDIVAQKADYPLKTCLVSGEELGSMGDPVEYVHEGRVLVQFCCESCIDEFEADKAKYLVKLKALPAATTEVIEEK